MKVMKFGGTSVGSASRMKNVARLITDNNPKIVVLSAMSGTTNTLEEISNYYSKGNQAGAKETINLLQRKYETTIDELYSTAVAKNEALKRVGGFFEHIRKLGSEPYSEKIHKDIVSTGEMMSTNMMEIYVAETGVKPVLLPALEFMKINEIGEPDTKTIEMKLKELLELHRDTDLFITQGFICRNSEGDIDNLQRGGSDYTASLIGAAIKAEVIEIWTDIDGMHNNDPRFVEGTSPVGELHFEEAAELAYFGAKILHPTCVLPAKLNNIPVRLLNTMQPDAPGTLIYNSLGPKGIKAVAAKDNITAIKIKSGRMLLAYGFLRKVFEVFEQYRTPIDMIVTSEVGVSVTVDNERNVPAIVEELKKFGTVTVDHDMVIVCVVGNLEWQNCGFEADVVHALKDVPVRMISYGGSNYNISLLVKASDKERTLRLLSQHLFTKE